MRSNLRLADLRRPPRVSKLMNVKVPTWVSDAIDRVVKDMGCSKTEVVIALLNEGLDVAHERMAVKFPPAGATPAPRRSRGGRRPRRQA